MKNPENLVELCTGHHLLEMEDNYVNYDTVQWILISLLMILVPLYIPISSYVVRQDIRTRKLYVTADAIVYKGAWTPSLPANYHNNDSIVNGEALLRKLEGIEASVKRLEALIGLQQLGQLAQGASCSKPASAPEDHTLRKGEIGENV